MRRRWAWTVGLLVVALCVAGVVATPATTLFGTRFQVGETVVFQVEDSTTWWWGCCACDTTQVLGWRIIDANGMTVYSVIHDAPVASSIWQGSWTQIYADGSAVAAGRYSLYVDTSLGTLSRCFTIYDPCGCASACTSCNSCTCEQVTTISSCSCRVSLVFVDQSACVFPFFGLFGGCYSSSSCGSCGGGCSSP